MTRVVDAPPHTIGSVLLVVNPAASRAARRHTAVERALADAGVRVETVETRAPGHATELARARAAAHDAVFTLGGDGTAMEVITALAGAGPPVGVLPGGTANVLARTLGVPLRPARAVPALLAARDARVDLGRLADGRHFAIGLGVGLDAAMIGEATAEAKRRLGVLAYALSALRAGLRHDRFAVRLTVDGETHAHEASAVLVANFGVVLGGRVTFGGGILHDDGVLTACVFAPRTRAEALRILWRMLRGGPQADPRLAYYPGRAFTIETDVARAAQADGELVGFTPVEIAVVPGAARLLVPRSSRSRA